MKHCSHLQSVRVHQAANGAPPRSARDRRDDTESAEATLAGVRPDRLVLTEQPAGVRLEHSRHKNGALTAKNFGLVRYTPQIEYSFLFAYRTIARLYYRPAD